MSTIVGFRALGPLGKPAIPGLIARLHFDSDLSPVLALCWIGPEGAAAFTNAFAQRVDPPGQYGRADILNNLAQCLKDLGSNAIPLKPFFIERLQTDPSNEVRAAAVDALDNLGVVSQEDILVLAGALKDREGLVRLKASMALSKLGPAARSAVPALLDSLNDRRQIGQARTEAIKAIKAIDPEAAAKAGLN
jgi:HEAT repeat protein